MQYRMEIIGCDDTTEVLLNDLSNNEVDFLATIAKAVNNASDGMCKPVIKFELSGETLIIGESGPINDKAIAR